MFLRGSCGVLRLFLFNRCLVEKWAPLRYGLGLHTGAVSLLPSVTRPTINEHRKAECGASSSHKPHVNDG